MEKINFNFNFFFSLFSNGIGDLLYYGGVEWLNISDFLGKIKKGLELHAMCFVFKSAVVFLCKERLRQKKKLMVNIMANTILILFIINLFFSFVSQHLKYLFIWIEKHTE